jgi:hypothetical protein
MLFVLDENGNLRRGTPRDSLWWLNYVVLSREKLSKRALYKFRRRFRMPYDSWKSFVERLNNDNLFSTWHRGNKDCCGRESSPIELLSLASLRYLGRKCTFDDLEEFTFISERTIERFFQQFIVFGGTRLYKEFVVAPSTPEEVATHTREMSAAGFPGSAASTDATTVVIVNCRYGLRQMHLGHKDKKTARTYNITVNHRRKILATTDGHPSRWNDKTVILFDEFINSLKNGDLDDCEFFLFERNKVSGEVMRVRYKGVWVLVDNGYLDWSVTIPPFKLCSMTSQIRWSQWLESMRKDVECVIGILKKRWTILDKGVEAKKIENADLVFKTCCALHNMLLEIDGYDEMWEGSIPSDPQVDSSACFAIRRLNNPLQHENCGRHIMQYHDLDESNMPPRIELVSYREATIVRHVRNLSLEAFRDKLVEHFDIMFHNHEIVWPKRLDIPRSV